MGSGDDVTAEARSFGGKIFDEDMFRHETACCCS
jgi:hypothetical protein